MGNINKSNRIKIASIIFILATVISYATSPVYGALMDCICKHFNWNLSI